MEDDECSIEALIAGTVGGLALLCAALWVFVPSLADLFLDTEFGRNLIWQLRQISYIK